MKIVNSVLLCLCCILANAQKPPIKFGEIPIEDMKMARYEPDSSAAAVVLTDYGKAGISVMLGRAELDIERHVRIKILKKEGLGWANAGVQLYHRLQASEKIVDLKASTYNLENGHVVETEMSSGGTFTENFNKNYDIVKFTLPNVKEGSVIEYKYKLVSDYITSFPNWTFQQSIPTRLSEYSVAIPDIFVYQKYLQGYLVPTTYEVKPRTAAGGIQEKVHHWTFKDVPAFKKEPYMTCEAEYVSKINFALSYVDTRYSSIDITSSWKKLNDRLLESEDFGVAITKSSFLRDKTEELIAGITDPMKKIEAIHTYVKTNMEWNEVKDLFCDNLKKVLERKKGSSADINLLLAAMLDKAGFTVDMVLLSTRDHGFVRPQYPMIKQFNYAICAVRVDGTPMLLDATEKYLPMNILPDRCLNGQGLLISKLTHGWIDIATNVKAQTIITGDFTFEKENHLRGSLAFARDGYDGFAMRKDFFSKGEEGFLKDLLAEKHWEIANTEVKNIKEFELPAESIHTISIADYAISSGDVTYINPFVDGQIKENPFKSDHREYPVDFGTRIEKVYMGKFTIPEGFEVETLPSSGIFVTPDRGAKYIYSLTRTGDKITLVSNFQINKSLFSQLEYPDLREFYNHVIAKQAEQIVLKKK